MVRGGIKDQIHVRDWLTLVPLEAAHEANTAGPCPPQLGGGLLRWIRHGHAYPSICHPCSLHYARRLHFTASSDGLLIWLCEEFWGRGLVRLAELLDGLLDERQAKQPVRPLDPELEGLLPL
jgi:hypothetical protein